MIPTAPEASETRFQTDPRLRRIHMLQLGTKLICLAAATYILLRLIRGRPLYPIPVVTFTVFIVLGALVCRMRVAWGTSVVFLDSEVALLRGQSTIFRIQRRSIQKVQCKKDSITFKYHAGDFSRSKVIGREGFPDGVWQRFSDYATQYVGVGEA